MSTKKLMQKAVYGLIFVVIGWFILTFILYPVVAILKEVFFQGDKFNIEAIHKLAASKRTQEALKNTYVMAFFTIVTVTAVGVFQILVTEYFAIKGSKILDAAFHTPLIYGGISLVAGYNYIYSSNGFVTKMLVQLFPQMNPKWFTGFVGVLFVHSFSMTIYHILFVKAAFKKVDYSTIEACQSLGGSKAAAFFKVALPVVKPALFSATVLLCLMALNSFAAPSLLGGKDFYMINSMILSLNSIGGKDLAALLSLLLGFTCIVLMIFMKRLEKRGNYVSVSKVPTKLRKTRIRNPFLNILMHLGAYALFIVYVLPILAIVIFSFSEVETIVDQTFPKRLTLANYIHVFASREAIRPFLNSVKLSFLAVVLVLFICVVSSLAIHKVKSNITWILEITLLVPWILPATMLAIGMISSYSKESPLVFNVILLGGFWLLPIAYTVNAIPQAMRLIKASLYHVNSAHEEAARSLGASAFYTLARVILPAMLPTIISVGAITFNGLMSEYAVSALLYSANNVPLGIVLRNPAMNPDPNAAASALVYIVVLMLISGITVGFTQKYRK